MKLRDLYLKTDSDDLDLTPLYSLPALHEVSIKIRDGDVDHPKLEHLTNHLPSWDVEFLADEPEKNPSLFLEIVSQKEFDHFDSIVPYGLSDWDGNEQMLGSELDWLDEQFEAFFSREFLVDEDYYIPFPRGSSRSRTIVLLSDDAVEAFPSLITGIQKVLCRCHQDWIIYFQSDIDVDTENDFIVWIYPNKIQTTPKYEGVVKRLLGG